jgi:4-amino-4-deoxy-L-arabinose transferase-like glycosyltransferase
MAMAAPFYKVWGERRRVMFYLWLWFVGDIVIMSASGGKRMHYVFPAMPAMAILVGIILEDIIFTRCAYTAKFARNLLLSHAGAAIAAAVGLALYVLSRPTALPPGAVANLSRGAIVLTGIVVWLFACRKSVGALGVMFAGTCVLFMAAGGLFSIDTSFNRNAEVFAGKVADATGAGAELIAYGDISSRFVHHYGKKVPVEKDMGRLHDYYIEGRWIVATGSYMAKLIEDGRFEVKQQWTEAEREGEKVVDGAVFGKVDNDATAAPQ